MSEGARFVLPTSSGSNDQVLKTNGSGTLSWRTIYTPASDFEYYHYAVNTTPWNTPGYALNNFALPYKDIRTSAFDANGFFTCPFKGIWMITANFMVNLLAEGDYNHFVKYFIGTSNTNSAERTGNPLDTSYRSGTRQVQEISVMQANEVRCIRISVPTGELVTLYELGYSDGSANRYSGPHQFTAVCLHRL